MSQSDRKTLKIGLKLYWEVIYSEITQAIDHIYKLELGFNVFNHLFWANLTKKSKIKEKKAQKTSGLGIPRGQ